MGKNKLFQSPIQISHNWQTHITEISNLNNGEKIKLNARKGEPRIVMEMLLLNFYNDKNEFLYDGKERKIIDK